MEEFVEKIVKWFCGFIVLIVVHFGWAILIILFWLYVYPHIE